MFMFFSLFECFDRREHPDIVPNKTRLGIEMLSDGGFSNVNVHTLGSRISRIPHSSQIFLVLYMFFFLEPSTPVSFLKNSTAASWNTLLLSLSGHLSFCTLAAVVENGWENEGPNLP